MKSTTAKKTIAGYGEKATAEDSKKTTAGYGKIRTAGYDIKTIAEDGASLSGQIELPEGEQVPPHAPRKRGEASVGALANRGPRSPLHHHPSQDGNKEVSSSAIVRSSSAVVGGVSGSGTREHDDGGLSSASAVVGAAPSVEIVRATTRFALDLRLLSPVVKNGGDDLREPRLSANNGGDFKASNARRKDLKPARRSLSPEEIAVRRMLERVATDATTARNVAMRALFRRDSEALDGWLTSHGGAFPKKGELTYPKSYSYPLIRRACPGLASGMAATLAREVDGKWNEYRFSVLHRQEKSAPHYRVGQPFPVRAQDCQWVWDVEQKRALVTVCLLSGGGDSGAPDGGDSGGPRGPVANPATRYRLPVEARDAHQQRILRCLASGEWKAGEVQIERDRLRPAKWYLRISYKRKIPLRTKGQAATVALGMRFFLVAVTADGQQWIYDGADIEAHLKRNQDMRRSYQRGVKASARVGHGRPRALKSIEHLAERSERYRQTRCSVIARRLATWLRERGVSRVHLGQLADIRNALPESLSVKGADRQQWIWERIQEWPYYRLGQALKSALEMPKEGEAQESIEVVEIEQDYHSQRCPACGYTAKENRDLVRWKLTCHNPEKASRGRPGCGYSRHLDLAQCTNALARASGEAVKGYGSNGSDGLGDGGEGEKGPARKPGGKRRK